MTRRSDSDKSLAHSLDVVDPRGIARATVDAQREETERDDVSGIARAERVVNCRNHTEPVHRNTRPVAAAVMGSATSPAGEEVLGHGWAVVGTGVLPVETLKPKVVRLAQLDQARNV